MGAMVSSTIDFATTTSSAAPRSTVLREPGTHEPRFVEDERRRRARSASTSLAIVCLLVGCGAPASSPLADPSATTVSEVGPATSGGSDVDGVERTEHVFLHGRFGATLPAGTTLTRPEWSRTGATIDTYRFAYADCSFELALRSDGRVRPDDLQVEADERWLPRANASLEVLSIPERMFSSLEGDFAAVGAVAFEEDGTATDLWVWPTVPNAVDDEEGDEEFGEEDERGSRRDPRMRECFEVAEGWLAELLPTLHALRPFASPDEISFGWDDERDEPVRYRATLPAGWVVSRGEAYDAELTYLHPRLPWARRLDIPSPNACLWLFSGDEAPTLRGPGTRVLGRMLVFDPEGCAGFVVGGGLGNQYLCLTGSPTERASILEVLETFRPVTPSE